MSLVLLSLSQKLIVPSLPAVEKVPYGWNWMSLTAYTLDDLDGAGSSLRWHCGRASERGSAREDERGLQERGVERRTLNVKLEPEALSSTCLCARRGRASERGSPSSCETALSRRARRRTG